MVAVRMFVPLMSQFHPDNLLESRTNPFRAAIDGTCRISWRSIDELMVEPAL
jgi:hypothetical protein